MRSKKSNNRDKFFKSWWFQSLTVPPRAKVFLCIYELRKYRSAYYRHLIRALDIGLQEQQISKNIPMQKRKLCPYNVT